MKREKLIIITILIFLVIIIFFLYRFFTLFAVKDEISSTDRETIIKSYDSFKESFDKCLKYHFNLSNDYDSYMTCIKDLYDTSNSLEELCQKEYQDVKANSTCLLFKTEYETISNYYISDTLKYKQLSFKKYEDYIDYDNDGKYFGKGDAG